MNFFRILFTWTLFTTDFWNQSNIQNVCIFFECSCTVLHQYWQQITLQLPKGVFFNFIPTENIHCSNNIHSLPAYLCTKTLVREHTRSVLRALFKFTISQNLPQITQVSYIVHSAVCQPIGSSRTWWSLFRTLARGLAQEQEKRNKFPLLTLPSLLPLPLSLLLQCLSHTFHPGRGNTPLRLLDLATFMPKLWTPDLAWSQSAMGGHR